MDDLVQDDETLVLSPMQQRVLSIPEQYNIFLGGGRGGAKSYVLAILALRHAEQYGNRAKMLYIRQTHAGTRDFESLCLDLYGRIFGKSIRYNAQEGLWKFPSGATMELNQLEGPGDWGKYVGRSFSKLLADEIGAYATPDLLDKLQSNLRGPKNVPISCAMAANPGDVGHQWIAQRYVFKAAPWVPFYEEKSKRHWVYAPSTFIDNPFIDQEQYKAQLEASCPSDPELLRAWLEGDWAVARGAYFASVLDEKRNAVARWDRIPDDWDVHLALDHGSAAPAVCYVCVTSPGGTGPDGKFYPRDSIILVDELATNEPGNLNKGLGYTVTRIADEIKEMCERWNIAPSGCADDAIFADIGASRGSLADEYAACGVRFHPARKADRISGWNRMRRMLADAGKPDVPGLYLSRSCVYAWATLPYLGRDPRRVEDLGGGPDHAADAIRYGILKQNWTATQTDMWGR